MVGFLKSAVIYNNETLFPERRIQWMMYILIFIYIPIFKTYTHKETRTHVCLASKYSMDMENKIVGGIYWKLKKIKEGF